jgi:copper chaperone CopZ
MTRWTQTSLAAIVFTFALAGTAIAETKVELSKTHICCAQCEKIVGKILDTAGVKGTASKEKGSVSFTAADDKAAQKVIDELAAAGFHGDTANKDIKVKDDSGVKEGKVTSLTLKGIHNCCGQCNTAIKKAVKSVAGVESDDAKAKSDSLTVKGNFDALAVVKALNEAGFHVTAK